MNLITVGLNHRTAPVKLREQFSLPVCSLRTTLSELNDFRSHGNNGQAKIKENIILSTCNRFEVYAVTTGDATHGRELILEFLSLLQGIPVENLLPHLYFREGQETVLHLMRVAAGLDSMILGEPQILGQVSSAWGEAHAAESAGPVLSHLFDAAAHAGKRARTETEIGRHTTSISHAAARLIASQVDDIAQGTVAIIGAGEMAVLAAQALKAQGIHHLCFLNRTYKRAEEIAGQFDGQALNWYHLPEALVKVDALISATGAPHVVLHESDVNPILLARRDRPLLIVDIAVPRDVEESIGDLKGVQCYDIDHLQSTVEANLAQRQAAIPDVEEIIALEAESFDLWLQGRQVLPVLVELRQWANEIALAEIERHRHYLDDLTPEELEIVSRMVRRIVNKMLHEPTVRLKTSAAEGNGVAYAHALRELFALEPDQKQAGYNGNRVSRAPDTQMGVE